MPETPEEPANAPAACGRLSASIDAEAATLPHVPAPPEAQAPAGRGTRFGNYELLGELGRGGMGVVYKARQLDLDRTVALKMILGSHLASGEQVTRFHTEARSIARLRHAHIVQVYESGQVQGQHYFAMEYVEGRGLDHRLRGGPSQPRTPCACCCPSSRRWPNCTATASCTATSSRRTSCSTPAAGRC
jgi:serine/threonine-protein kinase